MSLERVELLKKEGERISKSLNWAVIAHHNKELSDEEFRSLLKILHDDSIKVREALNQYVE